MDGQRAKLAARRFHRVGTIPSAKVSTRPRRAPAGTFEPPTAPTRRPPARPLRPAPTPRPRSEAPDELPSRWAAALGVGWPLAFMAYIALQPAPADPDAPVPALIELASLGLYFALVSTAIAAGIRHRGAAVGGLVTGLLAITFTVTCPVSGHHTLGLWWFAQLSVVTVMLALSAVALARIRR